MKEKIKEPRLYLCIGLIIAGFFPWLEIITKSETSGEFSASAEASMVVSGFGALQYSFLGILVFLIPIALVVMEFMPQLKEKVPVKISTMYLTGAGLGIILSIITFIIAKGSAAKAKAATSAAAGAAGANVDVDSQANIKIGFWLMMICFVGIIVVTLIKDFAISKENFTQEGIKNTFNSVAGDLTDKVSTLASENSMLSNMAMNTCSDCGASVIKGKKFCAKCGGKMPESEDSSLSIKLPIKGAKATKMLTVNEYIAGLKSINCDKCGESVPNGTKFCPNCGEQVVVKMVPDKCISCGGEILKDRKYCPDCGGKIEAIELKTTCSNCSAELLYGKKYCVDCGTKVE